jgi:Ca-activated chloride channel family protein
MIMATTKSFTARVFFILNMLFLCMLSINAQNGADEDKTLSPYFVVISENPETDNLPLKETSVKTDIVGMIANVTVRQVYVNSGKNALEAIYTFPLSTKAAVYGMEMTIGTRIITAKIEEKEKARKDYEKAKSEGKRASLLEQSRPNVFTMNVSNIMVNDTIIVELKYTELLVPEKGQYTFAYPTVVGPRYSNKNNPGSDDEFVSTPYTKSGEMPTYTFGFEATINAGIPIQNTVCKTHKMNISNPSLTKSVIKLDESETNGGNRDVIVNYSLQGNNIESGIMLYEGEEENFFLMMVQPPKKVLKEDIPPREYIFIVDVSGSMWGFPIDISKKLLRNLIINLKPDDKFNVLLFSGYTGVLSKEGSINATPENVEKAINFIDKEKGGGGTELMQALETAYKIPRLDPDISRTFIAVTDGYVSVEREAFDLIRKNSGETNFFSFGIGSSVNRYLIEGMAFMGNGEPMIITKPEEAEKQAEQFRNYINTPVLTRIKTNFGSFQAYDAEPIAVPDMLAERPIIIFGKYKGKPTGTITLSGKTGRKSYKQTFDLSKVKPEKSNSAIRYLWARERIKMLDYMGAGNNSGYGSYGNKEDSYVKQITELGLKYNLMTNYTSFIAIDEQIVNENGKLVRVKQPVPMPEGVSDYAVGHDAGEFAGGNIAMYSLSADESISEVINYVEEDSSEDQVFMTVETMPQFPGGDAAVLEYIKNNLIYPKTAGENGIQGRVVVSFYVETDGSISEVTVIRSVDPELDAEAIRLIKSMPKWTPGTQRGKPVRVKYTIPVAFRLQ